jgi:hypothetical protein
MLRSLNGLVGYRIKATDGELGKALEFLFDDEKWVVRYLLVQTGGLFTRTDVLISPIAMTKVDWQAQEIEVSLTKEQVEKSPDIDTQKPVSRQKEKDYFSYYGWPPYWGYPGPWGIGPYGMRYPGGYIDYEAMDREQQGRRLKTDAVEDSHLRSSKEVTGYRIDARDGQFGHVEDFILNDESWAIRYLIIDTKNYWPSKSVIVAPGWIKSIDWHTRTVSIDLDKDRIKNGPEYKSSSLVSREYEEKLYAYYNRPPYWSGERSEKPSQKGVRRKVS